ETSPCTVCSTKRKRNLHSLHFSSPERFSGESGDCRPFISQCELHFEFNAAAFSSDRAKIVFIISHLTGLARSCATAELSRRSAVCDSLPEFIKIFTQIFQSTSLGRETAKALVSLRQGKKSVSDYAVEFRTIAADSGWNQPALIDAFLNGLSETLKDHMASINLPADLEAVINFASKIDKRLHEHQKPRLHFSSNSPSAKRMRQRRMKEGRCIYFAQLGHFLASCLVSFASKPAPISSPPAAP
uniref:Retrotransposon gag domain-containing protein n=1 Tax=Mola mola TaxID=94237 RepID=A0A3Q4ACU0_MOLML